MVRSAVKIPKIVHPGKQLPSTDRLSRNKCNEANFNEHSSSTAKDNTDIDTSDEEELRNHVGNIPHEWYEDFEHFGYSIEGSKITKSLSKNVSSTSNIDQFLSAHDNKNHWKTLTDRSIDKQYILNDNDVKILDKINLGKYPDLHFDPYQKYIDWFTGDVQVTPISAIPESKRSFMPSLSEHRRIMRLVRAIRNGDIKINENKQEPYQNYQSTNYLLWDSAEDQIQSNLTQAMRWRRNMHWAAPKLPLPNTSESFNPPPEYLPDDDDVKKWNETEYEKRMGQVLPQKYECLRHVPAYEHFIREKFERCLDLYLCPRKKKFKVIVDPESLIPKLPSLEELKPFPSWDAFKFSGHFTQVTSLSISYDGELLASGDSKGNLIIWTVSTGRKIFTLTVKKGQPIATVMWNKNPKLNKLLLVTCGEITQLLLPIMNSSTAVFSTVEKYLLSLNDVAVSASKDLEESDNDDIGNIEWTNFKKCTLSDRAVPYYTLTVSQQSIKISCSDWHKSGDYILNVVNNSNNRYSIVIHQVSKKRSQAPFKKTKPHIQQALFHPIKPIIFVATQRKIYAYNLQKQVLMKTYTSSLHWISSMAIHSLGDNFVVGSYDKRISWFDTDLSTTPYKTLKYNKKAIRCVDIHPSLPLCCAASDDGTCTVLHSKIYSDLSKDTLIVPIKQLHASDTHEGFTCCKFHPFKAWLFAAMSDGSIRMFM